MLVLKKTTTHILREILYLMCTCFNLTDFVDSEVKVNTPNFDSVYSFFYLFETKMFSFNSSVLHVEI